ncbi:MAG: hypothetical protein C5B49_13935 [Bdellovibrio sp.]|nr:MAG: hypothetical protein C5B49_13935 [Bdellovibrio sp.]
MSYGPQGASQFESDQKYLREAPVANLEAAKDFAKFFPPVPWAFSRIRENVIRFPRAKWLMSVLRGNRQVGWGIGIGPSYRWMSVETKRILPHQRPL